MSVTTAAVDGWSMLALLDEDDLRLCMSVDWWDSSAVDGCGNSTLVDGCGLDGVLDEVLFFLLGEDFGSTCLRLRRRTSACRRATITLDQASSVQSLQVSHVTSLLHPVHLTQFTWSSSGDLNLLHPAHNNGILE